MRSSAVAFPDTALAPPSPIATVTPAFALLFAVTPDAAAARARRPAGLQPAADGASQSYLTRMEALERHLLGESYVQASRLQRTAVGRLSLTDCAGELTHADIHLVVHKCGAAVWEVFLFGPVQPFDVGNWSQRLDFDAPDSLARIIWGKLATGHEGKTRPPEMYIPLAVLRSGDNTLAELVERHSRDVVALLHRDASGARFKDSFVRAELAGDFCRDEEGLWLLARNGAVHLKGRANDIDELQLPPETLPLLLMLEVLCLDRAVLRSFLDRFAQRAYDTVNDLIELRRDIFNNLEEYYGTLAKTHSYTARLLARGEALFGIDDLFEAVADRLEALTFEITARNQQSFNQLGLWLTTSFGALETGFAAASIATWYYADNLLAVLGWTVGVIAVTAVAIGSFLRWRMKP